MSRCRSAGSYGHGFQKLADDHYRLHWTVDRYYSGVRGRFPRVSRRDTDLAGARRFAKRWGLELPE